MHRMGWGLSAGLISTHYTCLGEPQAADVLGGWGRAPCPPGWSLWGLQPALGHDLIASCEAGALMPPELCPQGPSVCSRRKSGAVWSAVLFRSALDCVVASCTPPSFSLSPGLTQPNFNWGHSSKPPFIRHDVHFHTPSQRVATDHAIATFHPRKGCLSQAITLEIRGCAPESQHFHQQQQGYSAGYRAEPITESSST